ncbi:hypothetical protein ACP70R_009643 [Stipagrostis hirtigluma subsp. patula]
MDKGFYKRARGIKHKPALTMPFYPWPPPAAAPTAPAQAGGKAKPAAAPWPAPATPPSVVVPVELMSDVGVAASAGDDVDRRAAMYISRVQERLRRERMSDDWRKYY